MLINEYLNERFGCYITEMYNRLAFEEVLDNKEFYSELEEYFVHIEDSLFNDHFTLPDFSNDYDFEVDILKAQRLLCAYLAAYAKYNADEKDFIREVAAGELYLSKPDLDYIKDLGYHDNFGYKSLVLNHRNILEEEFLISSDRIHRTTKADAYLIKSNDLMNEIEEMLLKDSFRNAHCMRFKNSDLQPMTLKNGNIVYPVTFYEFTFKDENYFRFYTTEKGFDAFNWLNHRLQERYDEMKENSK